MPFVDVFVPNDAHFRNALSREHPRCSCHRRVVPRVPGREERYTFRFGKAGQLVGFAESHSWWFLHQDVEATCNALADNFVARAGWCRDCDRFQSVDLLQQFAPVCENGLYALPGAARRCGQREPWVPGNRWDMLVSSDLAEADDGNPDRLHQRFTAATKARAFSSVVCGSWPDL